MTRTLSCLLALLTLSAACSSSDTTTTPTVTSPTTSRWTTRLMPGSSLSRTFTTTQAGPIAVTLLSTGAPTTVIGVGLGLPLGGIANCALTVSVDTSGGTTPQIVSETAAGSYCVALYDNGTLTAPAEFDLSITFP